MQRFPRSVAGVSVAVLAAATFAPPAVAAVTTPAPPEYQTRGVLDDLLGLDLGGTLDGLVGRAQQTQLRQLLGLLQSGRTPTGTDLAPLTGILDQLAGTAGLPAGVQSLLQQIVDLLDAGGTTPLAPGVLTPVGRLLQQLATTDGVPTPVAQLLDGLGDTLDGDGTAGLPISGALSLPASAVDALNGVLSALQNGGQPTAELLRPLIPLLQQVAATPGLPASLSSLIGGLVGTLQGTNGMLDPLVTGQLSSVLGLVGNTAGVDTATRDTIQRTTTILNGAAGTPGAPGAPGAGGSAGGTTGAGGGGSAAPLSRRATARDKAVVKKVVLNRQRTIASVTIACPKSAPATCVVKLGARSRGKLAVRRTIGTRIAPNKSKVARLRLTATATRALRRRGGSLRVNLATTFGTQKFSASKAVKLARPKAKVKMKAKSRLDRR
ncbi:hypothetical protein [Conexibacter sp. CPCC 206217]|uniref:hypothetical protein n=1 Tax=Conexibacter sp. CPCC 206217 TaxID=3064574 RepID=UPI002717C53B|nr:hypothetical protein [Conexibacter sp. CPCC 206217]MDO8208862.1 hypothetical protein [Conexibacter sp. CPCC 206217]